MIAQRVRHREQVQVVDEATGHPIRHTAELVTKLFDEELARILRDLPSEASEAERETFPKARQIAEAMIRSGEFNPV
jgi:D-ribose pyranose/furanose isomerase RbsD